MVTLAHIRRRRSAVVFYALLASTSPLVLSLLCTPVSAQQNIIDNGDVVTIPGHSLAFGWDTIIGKNGEGTLFITQGRTLESFQTILGENAGSSGTTYVREGSAWDVRHGDDIFEIGRRGTGQLFIEGGSEVRSEASQIGLGSGAFITGSGSRWSITEDQTIGSQFNVNGRLEVSDRGSLSATGHVDVQLGGSMTVKDPGTEVVTGGHLWVYSDRYGTGNSTLTIENGATVQSQEGSVWSRDGARSTATVTGPGSLWTVGSSGSPADLNIGTVGLGDLLIESGGSVVNLGVTRLGQVEGSEGKVTVRGHGSSLSTAELAIGELPNFPLPLKAGSGMLRVEEGGLVGTFYTNIGASDGSNGTVTVTGPGSSLVIRETLRVGVNGKGALVVENGGSVLASDNNYFGFEAGSSATVEVTGTGSRLRVDELDVGTRGQASVTVADGASLEAFFPIYMAWDANAEGTLTIAGSSDRRGTLTVYSLIAGSGKSSVVVDGGLIRARASVPLLSGFKPGSVVFGSGGAFLDTAGFNVGINSNLSGTGSLTKLGSGVLTLSEVNTYAGSTTLESGGIALAGQGTLGAGFLQMAAGTTFDVSGSTAPSIGDLRGNGSISLGTNSLTVASGDFNGTISGTAGLTKRGSGTLTLGGASTYTGGTTIAEGSLVATTWDALGTGPVTNNATLVLRDASFSGGWHFAPVISGAGQLVKQGPGLLTLTGIHHYQGGTVIEGGGIDTTATGLGTGPVTNNASLWINEGGSAVFGAGSIQGTGNFSKRGAGTLTFDKVNSYSGTTEISDGILALSGAGTVGSGTVDLAASGTLDISGADERRTLGGLTGPGRVLLGSRNLAVNVGSSNSTFDGVIAGTGGLIKEGAGGFGLYGTNTYTGTTTVAAGTLMVHGSLASPNTQVEAGATLTGAGNLAGSVAVQDGGTLAGTSNQTLVMGSLSLGSDATLKATLGGNGTSSLFAVTGNLNLDGRLVIDGASNLTGATRYTLLAYGGALTSTPLTLTSTPVGYKRSNFALDTSSGKVVLSLQDAAGQQVWSGGSGLWGSTGWSNPAGGGLTSAWEGDTAVLQGSGGTVTVEGPQTFSALRFEANGYTVASGRAGELVLTADGDASTPEGIRVESGLSATVSAPISGAATLVKDGAGTLNLTGTNTYTGGTTIGSGTLVGSVTSFGTGDILNNATLVIDQASDANFSQQISGNGLLTKRGAGRLNLTGISTLSGSTTVEEGRLAVNGSLSNSVVTVTGGSLGGNGTIGGVVAQSGGIVAPGNSIGSLHVAGDVSFKPGSVYEVEVNAAGQSDRITALGKATLSGGTVRVLAEDGTYQPSTIYTILTADAGVSGTFAGVSSNFAFLTPSLGYNANTVGLTLTRKVVPTDPTDPHQPTPVAFNSVAATGNQFNVANAVEALGSGNRLFDAVLGQSAAGARQAFDALSGEAYASAAATALGSALRVQDTLLNRLRNSSMPTFTQVQGTYPAAFAADAPGSTLDQVAITAPTLDPRRFALWGEGFGSWGKAGTNGNAAGLDTSTGGFILGAEARIDRTYTLGIAGGFTRTTFEADARLSSGSNDTVFAAVYGAGSWGNINLRLGATYGWHDIDVSRTIRFPNFVDRVHASYDASTAQAFAEIGYAFDLGRVAIEPFAGASVLRLHTDGFVEEGGTAALTGYSQDQDLATTTLGLRAETRLGDDLPLTLRGMLGWRRAYGAVDPTALLAFAGGASSFVVAGTPIDRDALVAEAGLDWQATRDISLGIAYSGQVGSRAQEHSVKGNLTWRFGTY